MTESPETPAAGSGASAPVAPPGARFDPVTGAELGAGGSERRRVLRAAARRAGGVVQPGHLADAAGQSGTAPQTYRWALGLGLLIPVVAGALGFLAFAFVAAAVVVPGDLRRLHVRRQPVGGPAAAGRPRRRRRGRRARRRVHLPLARRPARQTTSSPVDFDGNGAGGVRWTSLLVLVLLVPIVSEMLKQVGPLLLASPPAVRRHDRRAHLRCRRGRRFAAAETIVVNRGAVQQLRLRSTRPNAGFWVSLILSAAIVKPIVYGAATGIAVASFSGLGAGYDGFKPGYLRGLGRGAARQRPLPGRPVLRRPASRAPPVPSSAWSGAR